MRPLTHARQHRSAQLMVRQRFQHGFKQSRLKYVKRCLIVVQHSHRAVVVFTLNSGRGFFELGHADHYIGVNSLHHYQLFN